MSQGIHSRRSSQPLRHGVHQLRIYDSHSRNIVRVYTHHLLTCIFIDNHIIDSNFGSRSGSSRQCESRYRFMFGISHTLQRLHIGKIRVIHNDTDSLSSVNRRSTTQSNDKVCTGSFVSSHSVLYISNSRIGFYITIKFVRYLIVVKHFNDFGSHTKLDQILIRYKKSFLKATSGCFYSNYTPAACTEVRSFI